MLIFINYNGGVRIPTLIRLTTNPGNRTNFWKIYHEQRVSFELHVDEKMIGAHSLIKSILMDNSRIGAFIPQSVFEKRRDVMINLISTFIF